MPLYCSPRRILLVLVFGVLFGLYLHRKSQYSATVMEPTKLADGLDNDFNARLEQKLEQLKEVRPDKSWFTVLPEGFNVTETLPHGESFHAQAASIKGHLASGEERKYFLKLGQGDLSRVMLQGEYESMKALHEISPDFVPYPLGYGTYEGTKDTHFFMCDFIDIASKLPEKTSFCQNLAALHRKSQHAAQYGLEPTTAAGGHRHFGFPITTYNAKLPQTNTWTTSWESFHLAQTRELFELERNAQGASPELDRLLPLFYDKVIPRLLRPLETGGNVLLPSLIHGDLWHSNAAVRKDSKPKPDSTVDSEQPLIFDASAFYAHNEAELGMWRPKRFKMRTEYVEEYFRHFPPSPPTEDWEDRNLLYSLRPDLQDSALFPSTTRFRELVIETVRYLTEKYEGGYEGWAKNHGQSA